jgi:hypothetical protein
MHWSTLRALDAVARKGHARLDADLLDALSKDMGRRTLVCSVPGCPELRPCPKPGHTRDANAPWSTDRDHKAQHHFRAAVLARDKRCVRCGSAGPLVAHHVKPGYDAGAGIALCEGCHKALDASAR